MQRATTDNAVAIPLWPDMKGQHSLSNCFLVQVLYTVVGRNGNRDSRVLGPSTHIFTRYGDGQRPDSRTSEAGLGMDDHLSPADSSSKLRALHCARLAGFLIRNAVKPYAPGTYGPCTAVGRNLPVIKEIQPISKKKEFIELNSPCFIIDFAPWPAGLAVSGARALQVAC